MLVNMTDLTLDNIIIRKANNQDINRVTALVSSVLGEYGLKIDTETTDADLQDIEKNYFEPGGFFELIEDQQGNLLGTVGLCRIDDSTCELRKMYFAPNLRGRGLGQYLMDRTLTLARELGFKKVILETSSALKAANHIYLKYGFRLFEKEHLPSRADLAYVLILSD